MEIIVILLLILLNGFFALSEIALVSSKPSRLEDETRRGSRGAATALKLQENSEGFLSAIQVGITLIGIVTGVYGGMNLASEVAPFFSRIEFIRPYADQIALIVTVALITYVSIVIGELVPKTIALSQPEKIAKRVAPVIFYFSKAFYPFVWLLAASTNFIKNLLGIKPSEDQLSEAELRQMLKTASLQGVIEKEHNLLHENVFYFTDKKARHIMTHRTEAEYIDVRWSEAAIRSHIAEFRHTKILCCDGNLDNVIGILHLKDYFQALSTEGHPHIPDLMAPPVFVYEGIQVQEVLKIFRQKQVHISCIVNEYGGFEGIVTLHDIIEAILGHIPDEGETEEPDFVRLEDDAVLVDGDAPVEVLSTLIENFSVDFEKTDYATVAGYVYHRLNRMPRTGDRIELAGQQMEVVDMDGNRIDKVMIRKK